MDGYEQRGTHITQVVERFPYYPETREVSIVLRQRQREHLVEGDQPAEELRGFVGDFRDFGRGPTISAEDAL